jgi:hypothetical protein
MALCVASPPLLAKRREGTDRSEALKVEIPYAVRFKGVLLKPRIYRVSVKGNQISLADPDTMIVHVTLRGKARMLTRAVESPEVKLDEIDNKLRLTFRQNYRQLSVQGVILKGQPRERSLIQLKNKQAQKIVRKDKKKPAPEIDVIGPALARYLPSVEHCAERVKKNRWKTDSERFVKCVCPPLKRWRFSKLDEERRVHQFLEKDRSGFSFTVTSEGKAKACRVWVGATPPLDVAPAPAPAPGSGDAQ